MQTVKPVGNVDIISEDSKLRNGNLNSKLAASEPVKVEIKKDNSTDSNSKKFPKPEEEQKLTKKEERSRRKAKRAEVILEEENDDEKDE